MKPLTPFISSWNVTLYAEVPDPHGPQDSQQTTGSTVSEDTFNVRFVNPKFDTTHGSPENKFSCIFQLSAANLNSKLVFFSIFAVISQILSLLGSDIAQQLPHQLLKVPLTSGIEKDEVTLLISTWKVTLAESAAVWEFDW